MFCLIDCIVMNYQDDIVEAKKETIEYYKPIGVK